MAQHTIRIGHTVVVLNFARLMRLMAVDADGNTLRIRLPELAANHLAMHTFNLVMAFFAGFGDIVASDGGARIRMWQNAVGTMAGHAGRADDQTFLEEPFPVETLRIILDNVIFVNNALPLHRRAFAVAGAADKRYAQRGDTGLQIFNRQDGVVAVAILTAGSELIAPRQGLTMQTLRKELQLSWVTAAAIGRSQTFGMPGISTSEISMARDTFEFAMD